MRPPMEERYPECRKCVNGKLCYDWKQNMPNAIRRPSGINCPVDGSEIQEAIGLKKGDNNYA